jgi:phosphoglycolate phosphatase
MYSGDRLFILDADGTTIDAFGAIERTFTRHGMDIGDLERFQKRHNLFKYLGGVKEFPTNLKHQIGKEKRSRLLDTLTEVYREEAGLYGGIAPLIQALIDEPGLRVDLITRNITRDPKQTLTRLFHAMGSTCGSWIFWSMSP